MISCCRAIALSFGYVESNTTSWLIYSAEYSWPQTRKEALHSLVEYLFDKYQKEKELNERNDFSIKVLGMAKCCRMAWSNRDHDNPPQLCPTCDAKYNAVKNHKFSVSDWHSYLYELHNSTCNSYGEHEWPFNPDGWTPWMYKFDVPHNQMLIIDENAEHILTLALAELHPELKDLCSDDSKPFPNLSDDPDENHHLQYYLEMLDEKSIKMNHGYGFPENEMEMVSIEGHLLKIQKKEKKFSETIIHSYSNGGESIMVDGRYNYIKYNTGDKIFLEYKDGKYRVYKIDMGNGEKWYYDENDCLTKI